MHFIQILTTFIFMVINDSPFDSVALKCIQIYVYIFFNKHANKIILFFKYYSFKYYSLAEKKLFFINKYSFFGVKVK